MNFNHMEFAHSLATFARLITEDRFDEASAFLDRATETDPIAPARMAAAALSISSASLGVPMAQLPHLVEEVGREGQYDLLAQTMTEFGALVEAGDPHAVYQWWYDEDDAALLVELLVAAVSLMAGAYQRSTRRPMGQRCDSPTCPVHGGRLN